LDPKWIEVTRAIINPTSGEDGGEHHHARLHQRDKPGTRMVALRRSVMQPTFPRFFDQQWQ
jgi:hypothetical protein